MVRVTVLSARHSVAVADVVVESVVTVRVDTDVVMLVRLARMAVLQESLRLHCEFEQELLVWNLLTKYAAVAVSDVAADVVVLLLHLRWSLISCSIASDRSYHNVLDRLGWIVACPVE